MGDVVGGPWQVKCAARSKRTGQPCRNRAVTGQRTCRMHGGDKARGEELLAAQATEAVSTRLDRLVEARERLESLVNRAVDAVVNVMENDDARPADRMKAAEMILDRSLPRKLEVEPHDELRDLDSEIAEELGEVVLAATGTEDSSVGGPSPADDEHGDAE